MSTQVPDEPNTANDLLRPSISLFRTGTLPEAVFTKGATGFHSPEAIPETLPDEEIVRQAVAYFRTAAKMDRTVTLLRYHGAKGFLVIQRRQKEKKNWMAFCKEEGLSYWTLHNAFRLVEAVDEAVATGTFALEDLAEFGWNKALRKFGIKSAKEGEKEPASDAAEEETTGAPGGASCPHPLAIHAGPASEPPKTASKRHNQSDVDEDGATEDAKASQPASTNQEDEEEEELNLGPLGTLKIGPGAVARAESEVFPSVSAVDRKRKLLVCGRWDRRTKEAAARGIAVLVLPELQEARP